MLDALHHLVLVHTHGTFTEAARRAHLSQPALSASIRRLEDAMGARLLDRGPRGAALTAAGRVLLPHARDALAAVEGGRRAVTELAGLEAGEVRLGAGATACTYLLPRWLAAFREAHPGVRFFLREALHDDVVAGLRDGSLDLGVVTLPPQVAALDPLTVEPWLEDELVVVRGPSPSTDEIGWVTFPEGAAMRAMLARLAPAARIVMELGSIAAVKGNVRAGVGRALVSRSAVARDLDDGRLVEVADPAGPHRRTLAVVHRGVARLPPAAAALRRALLSPEVGVPRGTSRA